VKNPAAQIAPSREAEQTVQSTLDQCFEIAFQQRASDIHIEPQNDKVVIRLRIDGRLKVWRELPIDLHLQLLSRLKIMAGLDISDKRRPQDGRFTIPSATGSRDFRIATAPMLEGEKAVVRVLQQDMSQLTVKNVGYSDANLTVYQELLARPHGLLLHCGPTGSGKTTALYAAINDLAKSWRNIQTIEDPVESRLPGINQAQVNTDVGLTFAALLRSFLRQDCDVMLVGEVRDTETAQLAVQASLTGHLVLGTLHTNSATGCVSRLVDMGIPPFFIASALMGAVSQRLVRRLCKACRRPIQPSAEVQRLCNLSPQHQLFAAVGCAQCGKAGYRGRVGIQEVFSVTPAIRQAIQTGASDADLQQLAARNGMINIFMDGVAKAVAGQTTVEEVYKTVIAEAQ
jgi:type II secretory ATPase GspE/PulE/Tfp pilus assembly ATPase PilB-like protein